MRFDSLAPSTEHVRCRSVAFMTSMRALRRVGARAPTCFRSGAGAGVGVIGKCSRARVGAVCVGVVVAGVLRCCGMERRWVVHIGVGACFVCTCAGHVPARTGGACPCAYVPVNLIHKGKRTLD